MVDIKARGLIAVELAAMLLLNTACIGLRATPKLPSALNPDLGTGTIFAKKTWFSDYQQQIAPMNDAAKKAERDEYISALRALIDRNYEDYKNKYFGAKSNMDFAGDATGLLLAGAGTITGGARAKSVLAAVAAATGGLSAKAESDFYADQKQGIIVQRMDALRSTKFADIVALQNSNDPYAKYPLETAYADLLEYFYSGTPAAAISDIQGQSGEKQQVANRRKSETLGLLPPSH